MWNSRNFYGNLNGTIIYRWRTSSKPCLMTPEGMLKDRKSMLIELIHINLIPRKIPWLSTPPFYPFLLVYGPRMSQIGEKSPTDSWFLRGGQVDIKRLITRRHTFLDAVQDAWRVTAAENCSECVEANIIPVLGLHQEQTSGFNQGTMWTLHVTYDLWLLVTKGWIYIYIWIYDISQVDIA